MSLKKALFLCSKVERSGTRPWNKGLRGRPLFQLQMEQEKSLFHFLTSVVPPKNLIKSIVRAINGTSGTSGTTKTRNGCGLEKIGYFYKNIRYIGKVRSSCSTCSTPYKNTPSAAQR